MIGKKCKHFVALVGLGTVLVGCGEPPLKPNSNWLPRSVGGPIQTRPLPPAGKIPEDYQRWMASSTQAAVYLYEVTLRSPSEQKTFTSEVRRGETPVGRPPVTFASFIYADPTNGSYQLEWMVSGKQNPDFLRVGTTPKKLLLRLTQTQDVALPRLQVVAIEGVESRGVLVATEPKSMP